MNATFVQEGDAIDYVPVNHTPAGTIVVVGGLVGVAKHAIVAGVLGTLTLVGVYDVPKLVDDDTAIAFGAICYWDASNDQATTTDGGGSFKRMGHCVRAASDNDATVRIRFSQ